MKDANTYPSHEALFQLTSKELSNTLQSWSRKQMIDWLSWNDPSGIYSNSDSIAEGRSKLTKKEGAEIITRHVEEKYSGRKHVFVTHETFQMLERKFPNTIHIQNNWPRIVGL